MSFWNIDMDEWIRGRLYLDEYISAWYCNNSLYNRHSEFNDIIE